MLMLPCFGPWLFGAQAVEAARTLSKKTGIRQLKTEFIQFASKRDGFPFQGKVRTHPLPEWYP